MLKEQQLTSEVKALQTDLMLMKKGPIDRLHMENKVRVYVHVHNNYHYHGAIINS